jgi:tight adherence protein B
MRAKISAVSAEAKTSAGIIASLPVAVSGMMHLIAPEYMDILFTSFAGKVLIAGCAIWMAIGAGIMWKMIRFDF